MNRNAVIWVIVIVSVSVMLVSAPYLSHRKGAGNSKYSGELKGKAAPEFALESLDGQTVRLADFRGKAVLLNFWATWCQPCKIEMPWFEELQKQYGPQGLQVVGIAMDDGGKAEIAKFVQDIRVNYPILIGKESVGVAYGGVEFLPSTFFIDRDGKVIDRVIGLKSRSEFEDNIKLALSERHVAQR